MPKVNGFSHLAITVDDLERSLAFYRDLLGLHVFTQYKFGDFASKESAEKWGAAAAAREFALVFLSPPKPGERTGFISISDQPVGDPGEAKFFQRGIHHFGVWVEDYDATVARLEEAGVPVAAPTVTGDSFNWAMETGRQVRAIVVRDPDGNLVQLDELLEGWA